MKVNRRQLLILGVSGLLVASAIAIPVGIVYGTSRTVTTTETTPPTSVKLTSTNKVAYPWGTDLTSSTAPVLAETGYSAADYELGVYDQTLNLDKTKTIEENVAAKASVQYKYVPKTGKTLPTVLVAYPLDVQKGTSKQLSAFTADAKLSSPTIAYGATALPLPTTEANSWFEMNQFGYRVKTGTSPQYLQNDGTTALTADVLKTLNAGSTFTVKYQTTLDTAHYSDKDAAGATLPVEQTFTFNYKVVQVVLADTGDIVANTGGDIELLYGTDFTFPTPPANPHFVLKSTNGTPDAPVTKVTTKPAGATNTPDQNQPVVAANVKNYERGTKFEVTYTLTPESANYSGKDYTYTFKYLIPELKDFSRPSFVSSTTNTGNLANLVIEFAKLTAVAPTPPAYPGYVGTLASAKITTASTVAGTNSPAAGTDVVWANVNSYNAGTAFDVTYSYVNDANHKTDAFTTKQSYTIKKQAIDLTDVTDAQQSFTYNTDPATIASGVTNPGLVLSGTVKYLNEAGTTEIQANDVKALAVGSKFKVQWTYGLANTDNYEPKSSAKTTMVLTKPFVIAAKAASYTGARTYADDTVKQGKAVPASFTPTDVPEPTMGEGYELKADMTKYAITKASTDGTTATADTVANLDSVNTYHDGTEVTATYTFVPKANYTGTSFTVTKVLKVVVDTAFYYEFNWTGSGSGNYNSVFFSTWNGTAWVKVNITEDMIVEFANAAISTKADLVTYINGNGGTNKLIQGNLYVKLEIPMALNQDNSSRNLSLRVEGYRHPDRNPPEATLTVTGKQSGFSYSPTAVPVTEKAAWSIDFSSFSEDLLAKA